jgi:hypothetical protein
MSAYRATTQVWCRWKSLKLARLYHICNLLYTYHINLLLVSARLRVVGTRSTDDVHLPSWGHYHTINTRDQHCISLDFSINSVHFSSIPFLCQTTYMWETMVGGFWPFTLFYTSLCVQESMIVERDAEGWGGDRARGGSRCYTEHGIDAADAAVARLAIHWHSIKRQVGYGAEVVYWLNSSSVGPFRSASLIVHSVG